MRCNNDCRKTATIRFYRLWLLRRSQDGNSNCPMRKTPARDDVGTFPIRAMLSRESANEYRLALYCAGRSRPDVILYDTLSVLNARLLAAGLAPGLVGLRQNRRLGLSPSLVSAKPKRDGADFTLVKEKPRQRYVKGTR